MQLDTAFLEHGDVGANSSTFEGPHFASGIRGPVCFLRANEKKNTSLWSAAVSKYSAIESTAVSRKPVRLVGVVKVSMKVLESWNLDQWRFSQNHMRLLLTCYSQTSYLSSTFTLLLWIESNVVSLNRKHDIRASHPL